jgi:glycosyltransferase involved in cell wall biosynthesis
VISWLYFLFKSTKYLLILGRGADIVFFDDVTAIPAVLLYPYLLLNSKPLFVLNVISVPVGKKGIRGILTELRFLSTLVLIKRIVHLVTAISLPECINISRKVGIPARKLFVMPSPISEKVFLENSIKNSYDLRKKLGIEDKFVVLYHGSITLDRGLLEAIKAVKLVNERYHAKKVVLVLLGEGPDKSKIMEYVYGSSLDQYVIFLPPVSYEKVPKYIYAADACIVPLPDKPWWKNQCPTKLVESLAVGRPVIVTDLPGHRWIAGLSTDCKKAIVLAKSAEPEQLASTIIYLIRNFSYILNHARRARYFIINYFSASSITKRIMSYVKKRI